MKPGDCERVTESENGTHEAAREPIRPALEEAEGGVTGAANAPWVASVLRRRGGIVEAVAGIRPGASSGAFVPSSAGHQRHRCQTLSHHLPKTSSFKLQMICEGESLCKPLVSVFSVMSFKRAGGCLLNE
jgi:hypothetical protein